MYIRPYTGINIYVYMYLYITGNMGARALVPPTGAISRCRGYLF